MPETFDEQLARVRGMASGDETWDLSENDRAALEHVLFLLDRYMFSEAQKEFRAMKTHTTG